MIRIGFTQRQKQKIIQDYVTEHAIKKVFCFYYKDFPYRYNVDCEIEYIEYADIEMYKFFYRLLEEIDEDRLIVIDELMRTQNRSELIYNCSHHYLNQTPHRIVFEYFPIIEDKEDFMILLNFENKDKYHGKGFSRDYVQAEDVVIYPRRIKLDTINVDITENDEKRYERRKEKLFDNLGQKHPNTIPRDLQLLAGDCKKRAIENDKIYMSRNKRMKLNNVYAYTDYEKRKDYIIIDFHYRRLNFNDFLKRTGMTKVQYLCTPLPVDNVFVNDFIKWKARVDAFYAQANLYK